MARDHTIGVATPEEKLETRRRQAIERDRRSWNEEAERVAVGLPAVPEPEPEHVEGVISLAEVEYPTARDKKAVILAWLSERGIQYDTKAKKADLLRLVEGVTNA